MQTLTRVFFILLLIVSAETTLANQLQQNENQSVSPEQQAQPASPDGQGIGTTEVQSFSGCLVKSEQGYSLITETNSYPVDTSQDLSNYVNKRVKITAILQRSAETGLEASGDAISIKDIHLRVFATVIGDCIKPSN